MHMNLDRMCLVLIVILTFMAEPCSGQERRHHFTVGGGYADYHTLYTKILGGWCFSKGVNLFGRYDYTIARYYSVGAIGEYSYGPSFFRGSIKQVSEFDCLPGWIISPYVGFITGPACCGHRTSPHDPSPWDKTWILLVGPRAGLRLFKHIDIGVEVDYAIPSIYDVYNSININLGFRF